MISMVSPRRKAMTEITPVAHPSLQIQSDSMAWTTTKSRRRAGTPPAAFTNSKRYWGAELSLHTEPVSGFRAVPAVSAASSCSSRNSAKNLEKDRERSSFCGHLRHLRSLLFGRDPCSGPSATWSAESCASRSGRRRERERPYSVRNAVIGLTRVARRAGMALAAVATDSNNAPTTPRMSGSRAETP
jgi:hypothetical protein